jgi:DNA-binding MarR family transcriptional regulator
MDQSSKDDTLAGARPAPETPEDAVSCQSSRDKRRERSSEAPVTQEGSAISAAARFDEVVHAPNRLQICALLSAVDSADFATVRDALGVADSVLSKHVRVLHEAGYVTIHKATHASRVRTSLALTDAGRAAYDGHVAALRAIVGAAPPGGTQRRTMPERAG